MSVYNNVIFKEYNLTPRAKKAYTDAFDKAKDLKHNNVNNLHVFYGCIKNMSEEMRSLLIKIGCVIGTKDIESRLEEASNENSDKFFTCKNSDPWHGEVSKVIKEANTIATDLNQHYVVIEHIVLSMIDFSPYVFEGFVLDLDWFRSEVKLFVEG